MGFGNWRIGLRLAAGLGIALVFMVAISAVGIANLAKLDRGSRDIADDKVPRLVLAYDALGALNDIARAMRNTMLTTDEEMRKKERERIGARRGEIERLFGKLDKLIADHNDARGRELFQAMMHARTAYEQVQGQFLAMPADGAERDAAVKFLLSDVRKHQVAYMGTLQAIIAY